MQDSGFWVAGLDVAGSQVQNSAGWFSTGFWVTAPKVQNPAGTRIETRAWFSG